MSAILEQLEDAIHELDSRRFPVWYEMVWLVLLRKHAPNLVADFEQISGHDLNAIRAAIAKHSNAIPLWVSLVKRLRKTEDKGIGDTVQRIAAKFGGERFKAFAVRVGMPCGCTERQSAWNERWPY